MNVEIIDGRVGLHEDKVLEWRFHWEKGKGLQASNLVRWKVEVRGRSVELDLKEGSF